MYWPGSGTDPIYLYNTTENIARKEYYGISGVPNLKCDGVLGNSASLYQSYYNQRQGINSPVDLDINMSVGDEIEIAVDITAENTFAANGLKLRVALIALEIDTVNPGAGWTYTHFEHCMLDMVPDANGLTFNISQGQTVTLNTSCRPPTFPGATMDNLAVVAFVQNETTREVLNARQEQVPLDYPGLSIVDFYIDDDVGGNGNGLPEPGETCDLIITLANGEIFALAENVNCALSTIDPGIEVVAANSNVGNIGPGEIVDNSTNPFVFDVSPAFQAHIVTFQIDLTANAGAYTSTQYIDFMVGIPPILLVDDDGGDTYEEHYLTDLDFLNAAYDVYDVAAQGIPASAMLNSYPCLIWFTGMEDNPIGFDEQDLLSSYLDSGGNLFITSENLGDDIGTSMFFTNYMHAQHGNDHVTALSLSGVEENPVGGGTILYLLGGAYWPDSQSTLIPDASAEPAFTYINTANDVAGLTFDGNYKLVFLAFPYECIAPNNPAFSPRTEIMGNILDWFDLGAPSPLTVTMTPDDPPIVIPAGGGTFGYTLDIANNSAAPITFDGWISAILPSGDDYLIILRSDLTLPANASLTREMTQSIPAGAPAGTYSLNLYTGEYPLNIIAEDGFPFVKSPLADGSVHQGGWETSGWDGLNMLENAPHRFNLLTAAPNPFNPETMLSFELPEAGCAALTIFDIQGREIVRLLDGWQNAGNHEIIFDAADQPSGVYFASLNYNGQTLTQKLLLLK